MQSNFQFCFHVSICFCGRFHSLLFLPFFVGPFSPTFLFSLFLFFFPSLWFPCIGNDRFQRTDLTFRLLKRGRDTERTAIRVSRQYVYYAILWSISTLFVGYNLASLPSTVSLHRLMCSCVCLAVVSCLILEHIAYGIAPYELCWLHISFHNISFLLTFPSFINSLEQMNCFWFCWFSRMPNACWRPLLLVFAVRFVCWVKVLKLLLDYFHMNTFFHSRFEYFQ